MGRSGVPIEPQQTGPSTKGESVCVSGRGWGWIRIVLELLTLLKKNYYVYMCAERGGRADTIVILVPKSSDSCQSSKGEKLVGAWRREVTSSLFSFIPVIGQFGFMDLF